MEQIPQFIKEYAFDIVLELHKSRWFINNNVTDPRFALEFLSKTLMEKYSYNSNLSSPHSPNLSNTELHLIKKKIIENNLLNTLIKQGFSKQFSSKKQLQFLLNTQLLINLPVFSNTKITWYN